MHVPHSQTLQAARQAPGPGRRAPALSGASSERFWPRSEAGTDSSPPADVLPPSGTPARAPGPEAPASLKHSAQHPREGRGGSGGRCERDGAGLGRGPRQETFRRCLERGMLRRSGTRDVSAAAARGGRALYKEPLALSLLRRRRDPREERTRQPLPARRHSPPAPSRPARTSEQPAAPFSCPNHPRDPSSASNELPGPQPRPPRRAPLPVQAGEFARHLQTQPGLSPSQRGGSFPLRQAGPCRGDPAVVRGGRGSRTLGLRVCGLGPRLTGAHCLAPPGTLHVPSSLPVPPASA